MCFNKDSTKKGLVNHLTIIQRTHTHNSTIAHTNKNHIVTRRNTSYDLVTHLIIIQRIHTTTPSPIQTECAEGYKIRQKKTIITLLPIILHYNAAYTTPPSHIPPPSRQHQHHGAYTKKKNKKITENKRAKKYTSYIKKYIYTSYIAAPRDITQSHDVGVLLKLS